MRYILILLCALFLLLGSITAQTPAGRENPQDALANCGHGQYAQINKDGLVCVDAADTNTPACAAGVECCGAEEFVKITPNGLDCVAIADSDSLVCDSAGQAPCSECPDPGCCDPGEFVTITLAGLQCVQVLEWNARTQRVAPGSLVSFNLLDTTSEIHVIGTRPISFTAPDQNNPLPQWLRLDDTLIDGTTILIGTAPNTATTASIKLRAFNDIVGPTEKVIRITVAEIACTNNADCGEGNTCENNRCVPLPAPPAPCTTNNECATNLCDTGTCEYVPPGDICTGNHQCESGVCNTATNTCTVLPPGEPCTQDDQCTSNSCRNNICVCTEDRQCTSDRCVNGTCHHTSPGDPCTDNRQCQTNVCIANTCGTLPPKHYCTANNQCTSNSCQNNTCVCTSNSHCPSGQDCNSAGECYTPAPPPPSYSPPTYSPSYYNPGGRCTSHSQCSSGQYCNTAQDCYTCDDTHCCTTNDAIDGNCPCSCVSEPEPEPECTSHSQCSSGSYCGNPTGKCYTCDPVNCCAEGYVESNCPCSCKKWCSSWNLDCPANYYCPGLAAIPWSGYCKPCDGGNSDCCGYGNLCPCDCP